MQFRLVLLVAPLLVAATADRPAGDGVLTARDTTPLDKRACDPNGCTCKSGYSGVFCANCPANGGGFVVEKLGSGGTTSHVYQCDGNGGCCDYGNANDCKSGNTGRCG